MSAAPLKELSISLDYSILSYKDEKEVRAFLKGPAEVTSIERNIKQIHFLNDVNSDAQAYVIVDGLKVFVIFRGSSSAKDFLQVDTNIKWSDATFTGQHKTSVNGGVFFQFKGIREQLNSVLANLNDDTLNEIIFTGHSLGGGIANIAAVNYKSSALYQTGNGISNVKLHTFASPRVGDSAFNDLFISLFTEKNENVWRVFNKIGDPIPMTPSQTTFFTCLDRVPNFYMHVNGNTLELTSGVKDGIVGVNDNKVSFLWHFSHNIHEHKYQEYRKNLDLLL